MESLNPRTTEAVSAATPAGSLAHPLANWPARELAEDLHPHLLTMFVGTYAVMLVVLWLVFASDIGVGIALGVCTVYFAMYLGVPIIMTRMAAEAAPVPGRGTLARFLRGDVETWTGPVSGWGALAQMMTIPVGLTLAFVAFGIIIGLGV